MKIKECDYFVIGGGSGGVRSARIAAQLGAKVVLAEAKKLGGTCVNAGCIPKKLFSYASKFKKEINLAQSYGWQASHGSFNWHEFIAKKDQEITRLNVAYQGMLKRAGVEVILKSAQIMPDQTIKVGDCYYRANYILIATGGKPRRLGIANEELAVTSDEIFNLPQLPPKILIVGGGYIAVELAAIFNNFGVEVHLSYRGDLFLRGFDIEIRQRLNDIMVDRGINFLWRTNLNNLTKNNQQITATFDNGTANSYSAVLIAIGRDSRLDQLGLENTKVELTSDGTIKVNSNSETTHPKIFAVGDVASSPFSLTPVALKEGMYLAQRLFGGTVKHLDYAMVPTAVFSDPDIATVGITEDLAIEQKLKVKIYRSSFLPMRTSFGADTTPCFIKLIADAKSNRVLGLHLLSEDAPEIMQGFAAAISLKATKQDFDKIVGIHPTLAEEVVTLT